MSNSLSEQLLKAGLITQQQIDQAEQAKQQQKEQAKARQQQKNAPKPPVKAQHAPTAKAKAEQRPASDRPKQTHMPRPAKPRQSSDLEQFYKERDSVERAEREREEQLRREKAERKKLTRAQVRELIAANQQNVEDASIRYNFVVGETVKYLFVTEAQQKSLADGSLAITFMDGKRCLIPLEIAEQIQALDPDKLVVINKDGAEPIPDFELPAATEGVETPSSAVATEGVDPHASVAEPDKPSA